ncbi:MAG: cysteine desulfurase NifS, partial [Oscillospiraceae bacterium]
IAHGSLRLSLGKYNTEEEIDYALEEIPQIVKRLRAMSPVWQEMKEQGLR